MNFLLNLGLVTRQIQDTAESVHQVHVVKLLLFLDVLRQGVGLRENLKEGFDCFLCHVKHLRPITIVLVPSKSGKFGPQGPDIDSLVWSLRNLFIPAERVDLVL